MTILELGKPGKQDIIAAIDAWSIADEVTCTFHTLIYSGSSDSPCFVWKAGIVSPNQSNEGIEISEARCGPRIVPLIQTALSAGDTAWKNEQGGQDKLTHKWMLHRE
jgi:hypothetical protein